MTTPSGSFGDPLTAGGLDFSAFSTKALGDLYNYIYGRLPQPAKAAAGNVYVATDTGITYTITVAGSPPAFVFTPTPDVADIRAAFASVASLRVKVPTVSALRTYGT